MFYFYTNNKLESIIVMPMQIKSSLSMSSFNNTEILEHLNLAFMSIKHLEKEAQ